MPLPNPPVSFTEYNETLSVYNQAATDLDAANTDRNAANAALQEAQAAYDQADTQAESARVNVDDKLGLHVAAAAEIGVEPAVPAPTPTYKR